jgi:hypothetical protein
MTLSWGIDYWRRRRGSGMNTTTGKLWIDIHTYIH